MSAQADALNDGPVGTSPGRQERVNTRQRPSQEPVRVLLVADAEIIVTGLGQLLGACRDRAEMTGFVSVGENVGAAAAACRADVVLVDADHRDSVDLQLVSALVGQTPDARVVVLTRCSEERHLFKALRAGAAGYLLRSMSGRELVMHLERVRDGQVVVDSRMASRLALAVGASRDGQGWPGAQLGLSRRESDVLGLLTDGLSNPEIAERLIIGQETVKTHLRAIYRKLDVACRAGAVALAIRDGIFT